MNRVDLHPPSLAYPVDAQSDAANHRPTLRNTGPEPLRRLIVLVPLDLHFTDAPRRIWELANAQCSRVQFLGLCKDAAEEPRLRRQLVTLSALVGDAKVSTEVDVEIGANWVNAVKRAYRTGDMIVCFAEQRAGLFHRPLSQVLESDLSLPVYILSNPRSQSASRSNWLARLMLWGGSFGIIAGFFWLQVRISQLPQDTAQTVLMALSAGVEAWMIWVWNSLFG